MGAKIFGTDGVRGRANTYPMTVEVAVALGRAAGKIFKSHDQKHRIVVGKDTRLSCYMFENALIAGLNSMGVDTLMVGPFPTPGVAFITRAYRADAGVMISASHNPYHDNGIKFFSSEGFKLPDTIEEELEALVNGNDFSAHLPSDTEVGKNARVNDADGRYIEFAKGTFPKKLSLRGLKVALDCANGATHRVAPSIFWELGAKVHSIGVDPNGVNINEGCGSMHPDALKKIVAEQHADVGVALDGDGDRLIMLDEKGAIVDGDAILAICALNMLEKGLLPNNKVVGTVMSNHGFIAGMRERGIEVVRSAVGDRYVIQDMLEHEAILGGEPSGHIVFMDHNTTGDGLVAALQVLAIMQETGKKLSELATVHQKYPQILLNVKVPSKPPLETLLLVQKEIKDVEKELADRGRVLVRYSGTENLCRVMVEGPNQSKIEQQAKRITSAIEKEMK